MRNRSLKRRVGLRQPQLRLVVFCEGMVTEPTYFRSVQRLFRNSLVDLRIEGVGYDPRALVNRAIEEKKQLTRQASRSRDSSDARFEVWVVFDVDEHRWHREAKHQAQANGIGVALSNPCFELWALYHFVDWHAPINRQDCQRELAARAVGYATNDKRFAISACSGEESAQRAAIAVAIQRGRMGLHRREAEGDPEGCPSSGCHLLVTRIAQ